VKIIRYLVKLIQWLRPGSKIQISASLKGKYKGENSPFFGKTRNEETLCKISASLLEYYNGKKNPNSQKLEVLDLGASPTNKKTTYNSIHEASRALNIAQSIISNYFIRNQKKPYKGRFIFTKIDVGN
jgi:hypothetical protein